MATVLNRPSSLTPVSPPVTGRYRWLVLAASAWMVSGLLLDAWAHTNVPDLETFWTPWHAVMYSGIAACGSLLAWLARRALPPGQTTYRRLPALPQLSVPLAGMGALLVGGGVDALWHNLFGIERDLEIFVSPSHVMIILGMLMVAAGPALMRWAQPDTGRLAGPDAVLVSLSLMLALLPVHIFTLHASVLDWPSLGTGADPMPLFGPDTVAVHGYALSTVLLLVPVLALGRRWRLPYGVSLPLVAAPAALMWLAFAEFQRGWYPIAIAVAAGGVEVLFRAARPLVARLSADHRWLVFGALAPTLLWGAVLATGAVVEPDAYGWNVHATSGLVLMSAVLGAATTAVARHLHHHPTR